MALQRQLSPSPPLVSLLPALALVPLLVVVLGDVHAGGVKQIGRFWLAALHPSLAPSLLLHQLRALQITTLTALLGWSLSSLIGLGLGVIGSNTIWQTLTGSRWPAVVVRRALAPLRAIHELIWGLLLLQIFGLNGWVAVLAIVVPYSAVLARVVADQLDRHQPPALVALQCAGASPPTNLLTALMPAVATTLRDHIGHRLDCALRSALLLGVFGLGGLGTELMLSLQSLRFREMWPGLWMMAGLLVLVNAVVHQLSARRGLMLLVLIVPMVGLLWSQGVDHDLSIPQLIGGVERPDISDLVAQLGGALTEAPWLELIVGTLMITVLAAGVAIGLPPLLRLMAPGRSAGPILRFAWMLLRLLPAPLTALLLLLTSTPTLALAALALGLHHSGVMGLVFEEGLERSDGRHHQALLTAGAGARSAWLFGVLSPASARYLAYAAYRSDVILRDTAVVGLVGGAGLGWQLMEAISSFHWALVTWLIVVYAALTLTGEMVCDRLQEIR
ncbi:MAG: phosphonate ABC transporter [Cyanobacteriota bacterium]|nr:phosphonate ABC transporter [Cyanobacteriota bacterium]